MKKLIYQLCIFFAILSICLYLFSFLFNGKNDEFYLKFTSPMQENLIIGTSLASQGLNPQIINSYIKPRKIFNYAFTVFHSPYGEVYFNSISKKLNPKTKRGIFIVCIDPWSLGVSMDDKTKEIVYAEKNYALSGLHFVNCNPNLEYLLFHTDNSLLKKGLTNQKKTFLHHDGWLEVSVPMDSSSYQNRFKEKLVYYKKRKLNYIKSTNRIFWLMKTMSYLKEHGDIYVVRLPVNNTILEMEHDVWPNFSDFIQNLGKKFNAPVLDFSNHPDDYIFTDGNHLYKTSAKKISEQIGIFINNHQKVKKQ